MWKRIALYCMLLLGAARHQAHAGNVFSVNAAGCVPDNPRTFHNNISQWHVQAGALHVNSTSSTADLQAWCIVPASSTGATHLHIVYSNTPGSDTTISAQYYSVSKSTGEVGDPIATVNGTNTTGSVIDAPSTAFTDAHSASYIYFIVIHIGKYDTSSNPVLYAVYLD